MEYANVFMLVGLCTLFTFRVRSFPTLGGFHFNYARIKYTYLQSYVSKEIQALLDYRLKPIFIDTSFKMLSNLAEAVIYLCRCESLIFSFKIKSN